MDQFTSKNSSPQTPCKQVPAEALVFLRLLGKSPENSRYRFFAHKKNPRKAQIGARKEGRYDAARFERHQAEGRSVYVVIGNGGDDEKSITSVPALFFEYDGKPRDWQTSAWKELGLPEPSMQVETGGGPDCSIHTYFLLEEPLPPDQWRAVIKRLIAYCGSDPAVSDPSRVMRLPGFAYIGAEGTPIGECRLISASGTRYRLEEVLANVPELPEKKKTPRRSSPTNHHTTSKTTGRGGKQMADVREALACIPEILPNTGQRERFRALAWGLLDAVRQAGGSDEDAEEMLASHSPAVGDVGDYFNTEPHSIKAGSFWKMADEAGWYPKRVLPVQRTPDRIAPAGEYLGVSCPIPNENEARLVAVQSGMGTGKTVAIAAAVQRHRAANRRTVVLTHRRSLGSTLATQFDLPWGKVDSEELQNPNHLGMVLCTDSLCPNSGARFDARAWKGALVVLDEVEPGLLHTLMTHETTVAKRRLRVLKELSYLLKHAAQVIVADAQLSEPVLQTLEAVMGCKALVISSNHKPALGRKCVVHRDADSWRLALVSCLQQRQRVWISTTSQKPHGTNSAQNLAELVRCYWPQAQVLVVDSETGSDPEHPAAKLGEKPAEVLAEVDVVIASPAVSAGLSVVMPGHFSAVFGYSGGATDVASAVQSIARVRDGCVRHVYAAAESPGNSLKVGSGSGKPEQLLERLSHHEAMCVAQLLSIGWEEGTSTVGPWLRLWGELAALQNRQRFDFRRAVLGLLKREGYELVWHKCEARAQARQISGELKEIASQRGLEADLAIIETPLISSEEAFQLKRERRQLTPCEQNKLMRWKVAEAWALGEQPPTLALLEAHRDGLHRRLRWGWLLLNPEGRSAALRTDEGQARKVLGQAWAPDLCSALQGPRLAAADLLRLPQWLERSKRGEWFTAEEPELKLLDQSFSEHATTIVQVLGLEGTAKKPITELKRLLELAGYKLESSRRRCGKGRDEPATTFYRIVRVELPEGASLEAMEAEWMRASIPVVYEPHAPLYVQHVCTQKPPISIGEESTHTPPAEHGRPWGGGWSAPNRGVIATESGALAA